jgi:para-nitrobenzyl esterase
MLVALALAAAFFAINFSSRADSANGQVRVEGGLITGTTTDGVRIFKGVPYAAPPAGDLRWKPP